MELAVVRRRVTKPARLEARHGTFVLGLCHDLSRGIWLFRGRKSLGQVQVRNVPLWPSRRFNATKAVSRLSYSGSACG